MKTRESLSGIDGMKRTLKNSTNAFHALEPTLWLSVRCLRTDLGVISGPNLSARNVTILLVFMRLLLVLEEANGIWRCSRKKLPMRKMQSFLIQELLKKTFDNERKNVNLRLKR